MSNAFTCSVELDVDFAEFFEGDSLPRLTSAERDNVSYQVQYVSDQGGVVDVYPNTTRSNVILLSNVPKGIVSFKYRVSYNGQISAWSDWLLQDLRSGEPKLIASPINGTTTL